MPNTPDTSFPAVAGGASAAERERLAQWCEEYAAMDREQAERESMMDAYVNANRSRERAARYERIAVLLRATPASPVGLAAAVEKEIDVLRSCAREAQFDVNRRVLLRCADALQDALSNAPAAPVGEEDWDVLRSLARRIYAQAIAQGDEPSRAAERIVEALHAHVVFEVSRRQLAPRIAIERQGEVITPEVAELRFRSSAAPVGAPSEAQIAQAWDDGVPGTFPAWRALTDRERRSVLGFAKALGASLPPVEGAGENVEEVLFSFYPGLKETAPEPIAWSPVEKLMAAEIVCLRAAASDRDAARWRAVREKAGRVWLNHLKPVLSRYELPYLDADTFATPDEYADALLAQQAPKESDDNPSS